MHYKNDDDFKAQEMLIKDRVIIIVDSVVNSGASVKTILDSLNKLGCKRCIVVAGVMQSEARRIRSTTREA